MTLEKLKSLEPLFGSWYVDGVVAQGKNSVVYRGIRMEQGREAYCAIKTSCFPKSKDEFDRAMASGKYKNEAQYLDALEKTLTNNLEKMMSLRTNPNIIRYDNYRIIKGENCFDVIILMELLTPMSDYLSPKRMTRREVAKLGINLCNALEGFRRCSVMHREIKPENIFVDAGGNYKLGNFGLSTFADTKIYSGDNLAYIAPEVYRESADDFCSDVYSVGILMYKFINNNRMPFLPDFPAPITASDREKAFERRMSGELLVKPALADVELSKIVFKAAAFRPQDRYADPKALYSALERYILQYKEDYTAPAAAASIPTGVKVTPVAASQKSGGVKVDDDKEDSFSFASLEEMAAEKKPSPVNKNVLLVIAIIVVAAVSLIAMKNTLFKDSESNIPPADSTSTQQIYTTQPPMETTTTTQPSVQQTVPSTAELTLPTNPPTVVTTTMPTTTPSVTLPTDSGNYQPSTSSGTDLVSSVFSFLGDVVSGGVIGNRFVQSNFSDGDPAGNGKTYASVRRSDATYETRDGNITGVTVTVSRSMGNNPKSAKKAYLIKTSGDTVVQSEEFNFDCIANGSERSFNCVVIVNKPVKLEQGCEYYICFDEGAIESDSMVSLPFEVKL